MRSLSVKHICKGLMRRLLGTQIIKIHYLGGKIIPHETDVDELVKCLSYEDFLLGDQEEFTPAKLDVIRKRLEDDSYKAYGIIENNRLIYSGWISLKILGLPVGLKEPIRLSNNQGYLEDAYCSLQARGKGLHTKMISYRLSRLCEHRKSYGIVTIIDGNVPSMKAEINNGLKELGVFYCGKIFWSSFCTLSNKKKLLFDSRL